MRRSRNVRFLVTPPLVGDAAESGLPDAFPGLVQVHVHAARVAQRVQTRTRGACTLH